MTDPRHRRISEFVPPVIRFSTGRPPDAGAFAVPVSETNDLAQVLLQAETCKRSVFVQHNVKTSSI